MKKVAGRVFYDACKKVAQAVTAAKVAKVLKAAEVAENSD